MRGIELETAEEKKMRLVKGTELEEHLQKGCNARQLKQEHLAAETPAGRLVSLILPHSTLLVLR